MVTGLVITEWARSERPEPCPNSLVERLHVTLNENVYFDEISSSFIRLLQDAKDFVAMLKHYKIPFDKELYEVSLLNYIIIYFFYFLIVQQKFH